MSEPNFILMSGEKEIDLSRVSGMASMGKTSLRGHFVYHEWCAAAGRSHEDCPFCVEQSRSNE